MPTERRARKSSNQRKPADKAATPDKLDKLDKNEVLEMYRQMVLIRRFEEKAAEFYAQGKIGGFLHLYIGQEAIAVGSIAAKREDDHVITAYRDHGHALALGLDTGATMAELLGKVTGVSKGMGGSMHMADVSKHFWGGYAVVGGHLPLATGLGLAAKYREEDWCVLCYFGDGATNIGYFHEALNLAAVWKLPVLWICENNKYGMGTSVERASAVDQVAKRAPAYNMRAIQGNGMDVLEVKAKTAEALEHVRSGEGPVLLELFTYRFRGHSMGDPERYREPDEVTKWREDDPIGRLQKRALEAGIAQKREFDQIDAAIETEVAEAARFAEESPNPTWELVEQNVFVNP
jgi:pyruvate dehydrogenase E1 component alpha subunit